MADVTLSSAVRSSLLSLQDTTSLIKQTQGRLSSGLRVASAIDDPVAYFQGKGLQDRAGDLSQKKDGIDQGVSSVSTALDAVASVENVVQQLKGLANSLKSATGTQFTDLITQFNSLRTQIGNLVSDASYQGTNLVNNTSQTLTVEFSDKTASLLTVDAANLDETGLSVGSVAAYANNSTTFMINFSADAANSLTAGQSLTFTYQGTDATFTTASYASFGYGTAATALMHIQSGESLTITQGTVYSATIDNDLLGTGVTFVVGEHLTGVFEANFTAGAATLTMSATPALSVTYQGPDVTLTTANDGDTLQYGTSALAMELLSGSSIAITQGTVMTASGLLSGATGALNILGFTITQHTTAAVAVEANAITYAAGVSANTTTGDFTTYASEGDTNAINASIAQLDTALGTLRSQASSLGSNVALLQTRLDFTNQYVNTLQEGAGKLTLADINQEGANLLALQTRQQLGITSLSFAGQAEQSILGLF